MLFKDQIQLWWMGLPQYVRTLIDYGVFLGVMNALFLYAMVLTPLGKIPFIGLLRLGFIAVDIYFVYKLLKISKEEKKGYVDQVIIGTILLGVSGLVFSLLVYLLTNFVRPTLLEEQRVAMIASIEDQKFEEAKTQELVDRYNKQLQQPAFSIDQFVGTTSNGLLYSLIVAIFVRYKKPQEKKEKKEEKAKVIHV